jgi:gluconokinase
MDGLDDVRLVLLDGDPAVLAARLAHRHHEFMNPALLQSQLDTLERPADALVVDLALPIDAQVALVRRAFGV